jgi:hypothetical protein
MNKGERIIWEWRVLHMDADGDIIDASEHDTLAAALEDYRNNDGSDIELVRDLICEDNGLLDRQWAYPLGAFELDGGATIPKHISKQMEVLK